MISSCNKPIKNVSSFIPQCPSTRLRLIISFPCLSLDVTGLPFHASNTLGTAHFTELSSQSTLKQPRSLVAL
ncbi:hypothetical protein XENTR_v10017284 [Xenopus tropicalis]|nr:hypothetical protein XENTR_v10017284 [Xenopus tropicalis]